MTFKKQKLSVIYLPYRVPTPSVLQLHPIFQGYVVSQKKMCGESPLSSHTASFLRLFSRFIPSSRLLSSMKEFIFVAHTVSLLRLFSS
jgi:hypothetical protein